MRHMTLYRGTKRMHLNNPNYIPKLYDKEMPILYNCCLFQQKKVLINQIHLLLRRMNIVNLIRMLTRKTYVFISWLFGIDMLNGGPLKQLV